MYRLQKKNILILLFSFILINCTSNINMYNSEGKMLADFNRTAVTDFKVANVLMSKGHFEEAEERYYEIYISTDSLNYAPEHKEKVLYLLSKLYLRADNPLKNIRKSTFFWNTLIENYPNTKFEKYDLSSENEGVDTELKD